MLAGRDIFGPIATTIIAIRRWLEKIELKERAVEGLFRFREFVVVVIRLIGSYEAINVSGDYALTHS